jgi:hypothetical protein
MATLTGTYDPSTRTYTAPDGSKMSWLDESTLPAGTTILGAYEQEEYVAPTEGDVTELPDNYFDGAWDEPKPPKAKKPKPPPDDIIELPVSDVDETGLTETEKRKIRAQIDRVHKTPSNVTWFASEFGKLRGSEKEKYLAYLYGKLGGKQEEFFFSKYGEPSGSETLTDFEFIQSDDFQGRVLTKTQQDKYNINWRTTYGGLSQNWTLSNKEIIGPSALSIVGGVSTGLSDVEREFKNTARQTLASFGGEKFKLTIDEPFGYTETQRQSVAKEFVGKSAAGFGVSYSISRAISTLVDIAPHVGISSKALGIGVPLLGWAGAGVYAITTGPTAIEGYKMMFSDIKNVIQQGRGVEFKIALEKTPVLGQMVYGAAGGIAGAKAGSIAKTQVKIGDDILAGVDMGKIASVSKTPIITTKSILGKQIGKPIASTITSAGLTGNIMQVTKTGKAGAKTIYSIDAGINVDELGRVSNSLSVSKTGFPISKVKPIAFTRGYAVDTSAVIKNIDIFSGTKNGITRYSGIKSITGSGISSTKGIILDPKVINVQTISPATYYKGGGASTKTLTSIVPKVSKAITSISGQAKIVSSSVKGLTSPKISTAGLGIAAALPSVGKARGKSLSVPVVSVKTFEQPKTKVATLGLTAVTTKALQGSKTRLKTLTGTSSILTSMQKINTGVATSTSTSILQAVASSTKTEITIPPPPIIKVPPPPTIIPPRGGLGGIGLGGSLTSGLKALGISFRPEKYTPSFSAQVFNITAPKIPKPKIGGFTGLEIRPLISRKKKSKRKKK